MEGNNSGCGCDGGTDGGSGSDRLNRERESLRSCVTSSTTPQGATPHDATTHIVVS